MTVNAHGFPGKATGVLLINGAKRQHYIDNTFGMDGASATKHFIIKGDNARSCKVLFSTERRYELKVWMDINGLCLGKKLFSTIGKLDEVGSHREYELVEKE